MADDKDKVKIGEIETEVKTKVTETTKTQKTGRTAPTDIEGVINKPPVTVSQQTPTQQQPKTQVQPSKSPQSPQSPESAQQPDQPDTQQPQQSEESEQSQQPKETQEPEKPKEPKTETEEKIEEPKEGVGEKGAGKEATPETAPESAKGISPQIDQKGLRPVNLSPSATPNPGAGGLKSIKKSPKVAVSDATKKAGQAVMKGIKEVVAKALTWLAGSIGWPMILAIILILILLLLCTAVYGGTAVYYITGPGGTTFPKLAKPDSVEVKNIVKDTQEKAKGVDGTINGGSFNLLNFLDGTDKTYITDGKADYRLLTALHYVAQKHNRIAISHINSAYKDMPTDPESEQTQLVKNVSAHKNGLAADISQIDFVYKSIEPSKVCAGGGAFGGAPQNDIVYTADKLPTTDPGTIGQTNTSGSFSSFASSLQTNSNSIAEVNSGGNSDIANKLQDVKNKLNQLSQNVQNSSTGLNDLKNNVNTINQNLANITNTINQSGLPQEQKDALNQKMSGLSQQLSTLSYRYLQLDTFAQEGQRIISEATGALLANTSDLTNQLDSLSRTLDQFNNLPNISVIRNLGDINNQLSKINNIANIGSLGGELDGFSGLLGGSDELLRLYCEGGPATGLTIKEAIPIKVTWQDSKPSVSHTSADADESLSSDPRVYYSVYRPQAREKVHQVITELLQFPYDTGKIQDYRVTQLITLSQDRDVDPFSEILNKLYGLPRPGNYGLFSMLESWSQVHVGY